MLSYLLWVVAIYICLCGTLFSFQRSLLYHPDQTIPNPVQFGFEDIESIRIETQDGYRLLAWWSAPKLVSNPTIVFFHGNAGNIGHRADKIRHFIKAGYGVLIVTYRYNAGAGGVPNETNIYSDARSTMRFITNKLRDRNLIFIYGESLGTGVAVEMAVESDVSGVILEAPYTSIPDVAQAHYWYLPARYMVLDKFEILSRIQKIDVPLLIVHGEQDTTIPVSFSQSLYKEALEPKQILIVPDAGHNNLFEYGVAECIEKFIKRRDCGQNPEK